MLRTYAEDGLTRQSFHRVLQWLKDLPLKEQTRHYRLWLWAAAIEDDLQTGCSQSRRQKAENPKGWRGLDL